MKNLFLLVMVTILLLSTGCIIDHRNPNFSGPPLVKGPSFLNIGIGIPAITVEVHNDNHEPIAITLDGQYMMLNNGKPVQVQHSDFTSFKLVVIGDRSMEWALTLKGASGTYVHTIYGCPNQTQSIVLLLRNNRLEWR